MSAEFPALAEVLTAHRWQLFNAVCRCKAMEVTHDEHPAHQAAVWREACTIRTVAQLDALPDRAVIISATSQDGDPWVWERVSVDGADDWFTTGLNYPGNPELPVLLLWHPEWAQS